MIGADGRGGGVEDLADCVGACCGDEAGEEIWVHVADRVDSETVDRVGGYQVRDPRVVAGYYVRMRCVQVGQFDVGVTHPALCNISEFL